MEQVRKRSEIRRNANTEQMSPRELRRAVRLVLCLAAFAVAVCVKLMFPGAMDGMRAEALRIIGGNVDYEAALSVMGETIAGERNIREAMAEVYEYAFRIIDNTDDAIEVDAETVKPDDKAEKITSEIDTKTEENTENKAAPELKEDKVIQQEPAEANNGLIAKSLTYIHDGDAEPPKDASYEAVAINFKYTMPVDGVKTSSFGYRDHPVDGVRRFHYGTDLGADKGTDINAFADGVVYAIGESSTLGLYVMIDHADGVRTIYGHCSELMVSGGEKVKMGDKIAEVGSTGNATGNCLHFEIVVNEVNIDPEYYLS